MMSGREAYIEEVKELLADLESALLILESSPFDRSCIENVFRVMHTLKGNSSMFGFNVVSETVHELETIYDDVRNEKVKLSKELLSCTLQVLDHLKSIIVDPELEQENNRTNHKRIVDSIGTFLNSDKEAQTQSKSVTQNDQSFTYYIHYKPNRNFFEDGSDPLIQIRELSELGKFYAIPHFEKISSLTEFKATLCYTSWELFLETNVDIRLVQDVFVFAEFNSDVTIIKLDYTHLVLNTNFQKAVAQYSFTQDQIGVEDLKELARSFGLSVGDVGLKNGKSNTQTPINTADIKRNISSIRVGSDKLDELMNLVSELITTQAALSLHSENRDDTVLENIAENIEKLSRRLRDVSFGMTLIPIDSLFNRFQRMVRDTSDQLGKKVSFVTEGGETELDKSIIESLADPLMHILRNAIDHGIESPEERRKVGKAPLGTILMKSFYSGVFVYIQIRDDGRGIDLKSIQRKAIEKGMVDPDASLDVKELVELIFNPGFTTTNSVTDVSGRGVGMDVVKKSIEDIRGTVSIATSEGNGTTISIKLPLTLSVIDGLLVEVALDKYVIPLSVINKCYEVASIELENSFNELIVLEGEQVPFINLRNQFEYDRLARSYSQLIVVNNEERKVGISVDNIIGEYQAVVKPVGKYYNNQPFVSGATILGDGSIALILDTNKLIELYQNKELNKPTAYAD